MTQQTVLVAGASGYLGRYVVTEFSKRGYRVRALVRNPEKITTGGPNLEPAVADVADEIVTGDATEPRTLKDVCRGVDLVFSCMGLTRPQGNVTSEEVDHKGNKALLDDALLHGVKRFVYVSVYNAGKMMDVEAVTLAFETLGKKPWITHIPMWVGDAALFIAGFVSKPLAAIMSFAISVNRTDTVAPATGNMHLADFYRELAEQQDRPKH